MTALDTGWSSVSAPASILLRMPMAKRVCSSTVCTWYMSYCICATTRPMGPASLSAPARRCSCVAPGRISVVQLSPRRVRTTQSHARSPFPGVIRREGSPVAASATTATRGDRGGMLSSQGDAGTSAALSYSGASLTPMLSTSRMRPFMLKNTFPVAPPLGAVSRLARVRRTCSTISSARQFAARLPFAPTTFTSPTRCSPLPIQRCRRFTFCSAHH